MYIDFLFDTMLSEDVVLEVFQKVVLTKNETINYLKIASETESAFDYLLEYEAIENSGLCLFVTLCGYSPENEWNNNQSAIYELAKKLSVETNCNVYIIAPARCKYEMIKITPAGEVFSGLEVEDPDNEYAIDFECVKKITPREIKKLQSTLLKAELEERQFELQTQMEYSFK